MNKNILRFLQSAVLLLCCTVAGAVGTKPSKGDGTTDNPYQIATKDNLLWFADYVNNGHLTACAILTADITVNTGVLDSNGNLNSGTFETWTPIGDWGSGGTYNGYSGNFNGNGHTISGLYFNNETRSAVGLFGMTNNSGDVTAHIHDVGVKDSYFRGKSHVGGICGDFANGEMWNCWNAATVQSVENTAGGLVGSCWKYSTISGCYNIGKVAEGTMCGGICGSVAKNIDDNKISLSNCVTLYGKCSVAYNFHESGEAKIKNVTTQNAQAFADGTVCNLLGRHSVEYVNGIIPTSTTKGRYGHWHCRLCSKDFIDESCTIPATEQNLTVPVAKNNEIWYTTTDNKKLTPTKTGVFGATYNDANNIYEKGLGKITFDTDVTSIGDQAFNWCRTLQSITVPNSVTSIGSLAFGTCDGLADIKIPDSVTDISCAAFRDCTSLPIENNLYYAGRFLVAAADKTLSTYTIKEGTRWIGNWAFSDCTALTGIVLPESVTNIGEYAFNLCTNLSTITLPDGVTAIGMFAFSGCSGLQSVNIPGSVKSMGKKVFDECSSLNNVTIGDGAYIGENAFRKYKGALTLEGSLSGVSDYSFEGCTSLTSVTIERGGIGLYTFANCTNLETVTLQEGVTGVRDGAFEECCKLQSISIENGGIGDVAFKGCTGLTYASIGKGGIGSSAFKGCTNLSTVIMKEVTGIDREAFSNCSQLRSITIPGSVKSMGLYIFGDCTNLNNVTIEDGAYIGEWVFSEYSGAVTINGSLSGAGDYAFNKCTSLTSVSIKGGLVGLGAFKGCTNLSTATLLEGVTGIDQIAFKDCTGLKDIFVKWAEAEKIPNINGNVFDGVSRSKINLHVPSYTTDIYKAKSVWGGFNIVEDINFIITKTDDTKVEKKLRSGDEVTIDESEDDIKSLTVSENVSNVSVTYIRNFANADKWQGWYVPFDVPVADMAKAGFEVAEIYGILLDNSGKTVLAFLKMESGTVKANTPYVVRPEKSGKVTVTASETTIRPTVASKFTIESAKDTYSVGGIYEKTVTPGNWYAINKDGQFQKMGTDVGLRPFRIWMTIDPREDNPYAEPEVTKSGMNMMVISKGQLYTVNGKIYLAQ